MNILWITNILFPDICDDLGYVKPNLGGWMYSSAKQLIKGKTIKLSVATIYNGDKLLCKEINNIIYYLIPNNKSNVLYNKKLEKYWIEINKEFHPEVVHIHGTEFAHGLAYIRACSSKNVVVSIQGLVSVCSRYYLAGISNFEIFRNISFRDVIRRDNLFQQQIKMRNRGYIEQEYLRSVEHVIGRTNWDKSHVLALNPSLNYHFCNETLRDSFYDKQWKYDNCEKYSIFLSQAASPIKGLHQLLKALPLLKNKYPHVKVYVGGENLIERSSFMQKIKYSGYAKYLSHLINKYDLSKNVVFLGNLSEEKMIEQYLKCNVFVCPSSIENSPNSLGEAQILGVPSISAYVGGIPDMVENNVSGILYRFEEYEMLAMYIKQTFSDVELAKRLSAASLISASERHCKENNNNNLISIYKTINK